MANHVTNWIRIWTNPDGVAWIKNAIGEGEKETEQLIAAVFREHPAEYDRWWVSENCGAKWFYGEADYMADEYVFMNITSAWDSVDGWISELAKRLYEIDPNTKIQNRIVDEAMNFAGISFVSKEWSNTEMLEEYQRDKFIELSSAENSEGDEWEYLEEVFDEIVEEQEELYKKFIEESEEEKS
jgi:hypothetical protein